MECATSLETFSDFIRTSRYPPLDVALFRALCVHVCVSVRVRVHVYLSFFLCECCFSAAALVAGGFWNVLLLTRMCLAL